MNDEWFRRNELREEREIQYPLSAAVSGDYFAVKGYEHKGKERQKTDYYLMRASPTDEGRHCETIGLASADKRLGQFYGNVPVNTRVIPVNVVVQGNGVNITRKGSGPPLEKLADMLSANFMRH